MTEFSTNTAGVQTLRPKARLMHTLGDELISSEIVALLELVKNSYDADATHVLVRFNGPLELGKGSVEVIDNGHGMSLDTVRFAWLEPATPTKKIKTRSESGSRRVLGEKGIGRFAAAKLAEKLEMVTRRATDSVETRIEFDWTDFDSDSKYLDEVKIRWMQSDPQDIRPGGTIDALWTETDKHLGNERYHGTILRMSSLRSQWTANHFREIRIALARLISPFADIVDFQIYLSVPSDFDFPSGLITSPVELENPHYLIKGTVKANGKCALTFRSSTTNEQQNLEPNLKFSEDRMSKCGPFRIELRAWDRDNLANVAHETGSSVKAFRDILNKISGIAVYRDGFRIMPYGESNNDWLRLDIRRVQNPTMRLSNNQIIGYVLISADENPELRDQSNREGLMEGPALEDLRELTKLVLSELESRRYIIRRPLENNKRANLGGIFTEFNLGSIRQLIQTKYPQDTQTNDAISETEADLNARVSQVQEIISQYRRLSALGQLVDAVLHDGRTIIAQIIVEALGGIHDVTRRSSETAIDRVSKRFNTILSQGEQMSELFRKLDPFSGRKRGRPVNIALETAISDAFSVLGSEIKQIGAQITLPTTNTQVTVDSSEIGLVFINLLQNSLYWLRQTPRDKRAISVSVKRNQSGEVEIIFSDSGPGVAENARERIFDPYFSMKPDGIGLGLTIAGETLSEYYDGSLELISNGPLPGANFRITLRKRI